ncbi:hypothetical protein LZF95_07055 [Algoriphagus sp. AGSA1]|uniref:hypothetical protein n=1 Tax=Algoriphagus sp. AGSA1 TaxID=2907213 RepID=UPI001F1593AC|nr:hypothetical protein [Algoriphagus sp. AGSA1]MCE7054424.1 hypothetical protein [Algoriphagus sp. AGSA1]
MQKQDLNVAFKDYNPNQLMFFPPSLEELIVPHWGSSVSGLTVSMGKIGVGTALNWLNKSFWNGF